MNSIIVIIRQLFRIRKAQSPLASQENDGIGLCHLYVEHEAIEEIGHLIFWARLINTLLVLLFLWMLWNSEVLRKYFPGADNENREGIVDLRKRLTSWHQGSWRRLAWKEGLEEHSLLQLQVVPSHWEVSHLESGRTPTPSSRCMWACSCFQGWSQQLSGRCGTRQGTPTWVCIRIT